MACATRSCGWRSPHWKPPHPPPSPPHRLQPPVANDVGERGPEIHDAYYFFRLTLSRKRARGQKVPLRGRFSSFLYFCSVSKSMCMRSQVCNVVVAALLCVGVSGCSSSSDGLEPVEGTVTFDGEPIKEGRIQFRGTTDSRAFSAPIVDGKYSTELPEGASSVEITASRPVPGKFDESNPGERVPVGEMYIPAKYNSQTELTADIASGPNAVDFALTSE